MPAAKDTFAAMNRLPLPQELYLIAHEPSGKPLVHQSSMALGLAGAALLELALSDRVTIARGRGIVADGTPVGDAVADGLLPLILRDRFGGDVKSWIKKAAGDVYDRTRGSLITAGVLTQVTKRRMGVLSQTRHELADMAWVVRACSGVRSAVEGREQPDARCAALCGLVGVLKVDAALYLGRPSSQLVGRLRAIAGENSPVVQEVVGIVETLINEAAIAVYR
ncbi:GPP34 family phosphoprotein [Streptosporangium sp. NPDC051023]|uniref:GOLPH3/VPS74 family protein n=1 Tax=Streptosporangium sp. NPDC051023 TaxID=3155410 RepID=UPI00344CA025